MGEVNELEKRERKFKIKFEITFSSFAYVEGYINCDSPFISKCKVCGHVQERNASCIRHPNRKLKCDNCIKINSKINKQKRKEKYKLEAIKLKLERKILRHEETIKRNLAKREEIKKERLKKPIICKECGELFTRKHGKQLYCSDICRNKASNRKNEINRRHKLRENGKIDWDITLKKLTERDQGICKICGSRVNINDYKYDSKGNFIAGNEYPSIDHIKPVSKGGTHRWNNIQLAHRYCNSIKSDIQIINMIDTDKI